MTLPSETRLPEPLWKWFMLRRSDVDPMRALTVQAHTFDVQGAPAGWLVTFNEWVHDFLDDGEPALVGYTRRAYAIPAGVTFDVVEVEMPAGGTTH